MNGYRLRPLASAPSLNSSDCRTMDLIADPNMTTASAVEREG
jgi:hypothetical protein